MPNISAGEQTPNQLYTVEERRRRDETSWTLVQGVLAPVQFLAFIISSYHVIVFLLTGEGYEAATISIVVKTILLYTIMITGAMWEKVVFGRYLLAPAFFWEDMVSFVVIALHSAYLVLLFVDSVEEQAKIYVAVVAYFAYLINAIQFLIKFRMARSSGKSQDLEKEGALA